MVFNIGNARLVTVLPTLQQQIDRSKWATRAWTYQEAVLSPRNIYFTHDQVYFACNIMQYCEAIQETMSPFHNTAHKERFGLLSSCLCHEGPDKALGKGIFRNPIADLPPAPPQDQSPCPVRVDRKSSVGTLSKIALCSLCGGGQKLGVGPHCT